MDWPGHNDGVWRYNEQIIDNNLYNDGRWRYISFDFDFTRVYQFSMGGFGGGDWGAEQQKRRI